MLSFIGALLNGFLADKFGRKCILYSTFVCHTIGWLMVALTPYIIAGRLLISLGNGNKNTYIPFYNFLIRNFSEEFRTKIFELLSGTHSVGILQNFGIKY